MFEPPFEPGQHNMEALQARRRSLLSELIKRASAADWEDVVTCARELTTIDQLLARSPAGSRRAAHLPRVSVVDLGDERPPDDG